MNAVRLRVYMVWLLPAGPRCFHRVFSGCQMRLVAICWERAVLLAFHLCCFILCLLNCLYSFPVWSLWQDVEFDCISTVLVIAISCTLEAVLLFDLNTIPEVIWNKVSVVIFRFSGPLGLWGSTMSWRLSIAHPSVRRREGCRIFLYLSWTDSIKPSLRFLNFGCCISKGFPFQIILLKCYLCHFPVHSKSEIL